MNGDFKWLRDISRPYGKAVAINSLAGILRIGTSLAFVWICKHLIDIATHLADGSFVAYSILMAVCPLLQLALGAVSMRVENKSEIGMRNRLRKKMFSHLMTSSWLDGQAFHSGDIMNRLSADVQTLSNAVCRDIPFMVITLFQLAGALAFFIVLDFRLALILVPVMPIALIVSKIYMRRLRRLTSDIRSGESRIQACLQESVQNHTLIQTMNFTGYAESRLQSLQSAFGRLVMRRSDFSMFSRIVVQMGFSLGYAIAFLWGAWGLYNGSITFGVMAAFLQLVGQVQRPVVDLSRQIPSFVQAFTAADRLSEILALPAEECSGTELLSGRIGVRLQNVHYTYPDGNVPAVAGFSHDFTPGSITAIVGETGAGKSTLFRLMLALIRPEKGAVAFYDADHEVVASSSTRSCISYIPQGNSLMSGTIRENLLMGNPDASDDQLTQALHSAVAEFVFDLPEGMDARCGERGSGLSEGQAQRIAIARGLLRPGNVLLLDEPTSNLDSDTEKKLLERLSSLARSKTIIIITHSSRVASFCNSQVHLS